MAKNSAYMELYERTLARSIRRLHEGTDKPAGRIRLSPAIKGPTPIAYFSTEYGLHESLPIYSGGLGILSGDHLKTASDLHVPLVAVGLLYRCGYFRQRIDKDGWQVAEYP